MVSAVFAPLMLCRIGKQECFFCLKYGSASEVCQLALYNLCN